MWIMVVVMMMRMMVMLMVLKMIMAIRQFTSIHAETTNAIQIIGRVTADVATERLTDFVSVDFRTIFIVGYYFLSDVTVVTSVTSIFSTIAIGGHAVSVGIARMVLME